MATEKRLIDANALLKMLEKRTKTAYPNEFYGLMLAHDYIDDAPTVDAVEVVYCQDCARCKKGFCTIRKDSWGTTLKVGLHDFCSDGERKDQ